MKLVILILGFTSISGLIQTHYKRLHLDDTEWPGYISKTVPFKGHLILLRKKTAFLSGTSIFFGPSYFETALIRFIKEFEFWCCNLT